MSKLKKIGYTALALGTAGVGIAQTSAATITGSGVQLEQADLDTIQNGAEFGVTTQFEALKLIGVSILIGAATWLVNKAFNAPMKAFSGGN